jgi:glutathione S-transferase
MTLTVIGPRRTRAFRVIWLLEELGLDYELQEKFPHSDDVVALNPLREVPVLTEGDTVLTDSLAIGLWLTDREDRMTFPVGSAARARMIGQINFVISELEVPCWMSARHRFVLPEERRRTDLHETLAADFADAEAKFARLLGGSEFFAGDSFTLADIFAAHVAAWGLLEKFGHKTDAMRDYLDRMSARPAFQRARGEA